MAPLARIVPGKRYRIGSDPASVALYDRLAGCGALDILGWETNSHGTVTSPNYYRTHPCKAEPLGYWHEVTIRNGLAPEGLAPREPGEDDDKD